MCAVKVALNFLQIRKSSYWELFLFNCFSGYQPLGGYILARRLTAAAAAAAAAQTHRFKPGHENRRINLTFLYGERQSTIQRRKARREQELAELEREGGKRRHEL